MWIWGGKISSVKQINTWTGKEKFKIDINKIKSKSK
jgi:hypothetical protein